MVNTCQSTDVKIDVTRFFSPSLSLPLISGTTIICHTSLSLNRPQCISPSDMQLQSPTHSKVAPR